MGYGSLAHFKGPSSFWARVIPGMKKRFITSGPDLGPHCLQRLSAYDKSQLTASQKELKFVLMHTQKLPLTHVSPFYFRARIQISDDSP